MDLPPATPLPDSLMTQFTAIRDQYLPMLKEAMPQSLAELEKAEKQTTGKVKKGNP
ncbi:MAG: hypothetical protein R2795_04570 [Saprospiraceae bacterium]